MLVEENHITLSMIEDKFGLTKRVSMSLLGELKEEIYEMEKDSLFQLITIDNNYYLGPDFDSVKYTNNYYSIKSDYYNNSSLFLVMVYLLEKRKSSIAELSNELVYSQSYTYKLIDSLNDFAETMNVNVYIEKNDNSIELVGVETEIRLMYYYSCIYGFGTFEWPFHSFSQERI